jgi:hypothetical protein
MSTKVLGLAFVVLLSSAVVAQDAPEKKKKRAAAGRNNAAANVLKQLEAVGLTDEQKTKIQELAKKSQSEMRAARTEAGITPEIMKARMEAQKEMRETIKKPAELAAAVNKKLGLNEAQIAAFKKAEANRAAMLKSAIALLSDDQKAKLPARLVKSTAGRDAAPGKGKGKGKKKKQAEEN